MAKKPDLPEELRKWFVAQGRKGGKLGSWVLIEKYTPEQLSERMRLVGIASGKTRRKRGQTAKGDKKNA